MNAHILTLQSEGKFRWNDGSQASAVAIISHLTIAKESNMYPPARFDISRNIIDIDLTSETSVLAALDTMLKAVESYEALEHYTIKNIDKNNAGYLSFHYRNPNDGTFYDPNTLGQFDWYQKNEIPEHIQKSLDAGTEYFSNEVEVLKEIAKLPYAYQKMKQYVMRLTQLHQEGEIENDTSGAHSALNLAINHLDAVPLLGKYWQKSRTHHNSLFTDLIDAHGVTIETLTIVFDHMMVSYNTPSDQQATMAQLRKYTEYRDIERNNPALWFEALDNALALQPIQHLAFVIPKNTERLCVLFLELTMEGAPNMRHEFEIRANKYPIIPKFLSVYDQKAASDRLPNQIDIDLQQPIQSKLSEALDRMIAIMKSESALQAVLLEDEDSALFWAFGTADSNNTFQIADHKYDSEELFFKLASEYSDLHPKIVEYAAQVTTYMEVKEKSLHTDCEHYAADWAWFYIALKDKEVIKHYIRYLRTNDLSHEVCQSHHIVEIILKHGIIKETLDLLAARMMMGGQHHNKDLEAVNGELKLVEHFQKQPQDFEHFCQQLVANQHFIYSNLDEDLDEYLWEDLYNQDETAIDAAHQTVLKHLALPISKPNDQSISYKHIQVSDPDINGPDNIIQPLKYTPAKQTKSLIEQDCFPLFEKPPGVRYIHELEGDIHALDLEDDFIWFTYSQNKQDYLAAIDLKRPKKINQSIPLKKRASQIKVHGDIAILVTNANDDKKPTVYAYDLKNGNILYSIDLEEDVTCLCINPTGSTVAVGLDPIDGDNCNDEDEDESEEAEEKNTILILNLQTGETIKSFTYEGYDYNIKSLAYSSCGKWLIASYDEETHLRDTTDWSLKHKVRNSGKIVNNINRDSFFLLSRNSIYRYTYADVNELPSCTANEKLNRFYQMGASLPQNRIVVRDRNKGKNNLDIYDLETQQLLTTIKLPAYDLRSIHYSPSTQSLIAVTKCSELLIWNWEYIESNLDQLLSGETPPTRDKKGVFRQIFCA